jgi:hypothetical protein
MHDLGVIKTDKMPAHGSPQDRGSADAYYGRRYNPHYYDDTVGLIVRELMTPSEIEAYEYGYDNEEDRKDYE